jgi:hypothetical protein
MRYVLICISVLLSIFGIFLYGCKKEESLVGNPPTIQFITDSGFVYKDTILKTGDKYRIGIICKGRSYKITYFNYTLTNEKGKSSVDSGMNSIEFRWETVLTKGSSKSDIWAFYVRDRESNSSDTIRIKISIDSNSVYGKINSVPEVVLGAQSNSAYPEFYSVQNFQTFNAIQAYQNQSKIDLVYYYDPITGDNNSIASPGANIDSNLFSGPYPIQWWIVKNTTRFELSSISTSEFNASSNDSLILANTFPFASGKRKAKNLVKDNIYSFVTQSGIKGIFKVNDVSGTDAGFIKISLKIQD